MRLTYDEQGVAELLVDVEVAHISKDGVANIRIRIGDEVTAYIPAIEGDVVQVRLNVQEA